MPEPMLTQICITIWHQQATMSEDNVSRLCLHQFINHHNVTGFQIRACYGSVYLLSFIHWKPWIVTIPTFSASLVMTKLASCQLLVISVLLDLLKGIFLFYRWHFSYIFSNEKLCIFIDISACFHCIKILNEKILGKNIPTSTVLICTLPISLV